MRVNDFRIGNLIRTKEEKHTCRVTMLGNGIFHVDIYKGYNNSIEAFEPLPVTKSILDSIGCSFGKKSILPMIHFKLPESRIYGYLFDDGNYCISGHKDRVLLKGFHQLQNYYHAVTGGELKLNLHVGTIKTETTL